ncbi:hypothetical protein A5676_26030 [Mycobacterium malmoense]|nr:hypothetical protein A5676_26030 [Mycobacterium malmoense]
MPAARSTRTDSRAVAPVVRMSSTTRTSVTGRVPRSSTRPATLRSRAVLPSPTESRTSARSRSAGATAMSGWPATALRAAGIRVTAVLTLAVA